MTDISDEDIETSPASGKEILDATQNAVIEAVENVSEIIEVKETKQESVKTVEEDIEHQAFYTETEFWIGVAFVVVVVALFKTATVAVRKLLQKKVDNIVNQIDEAVSLRDDAQKLLADYERKLLSAKQESEAIAAENNAQIKFLQEEQMAHMRAEINKQVADTENRISVAVNNAKNEITDAICGISIRLTEKFCQTQITEEEKNKLIDKSIKLLGNLK